MKVILVTITCTVLYLGLSALPTESSAVGRKRGLGQLDKNRPQSMSSITFGSGFTKFRLSKDTESRFDPSEILGGYNASEEVYNHLASVKTIIGKWSYGCSGSIIGPDLVLCAAHCFTNKRGEFNVRDGWVYIGQFREGTKRYFFENVYVHLSYSSITHVSDIAIIRVSSPFDPPYSTVVLPRGRDRLPRKSIVYAAGFGYTSYEGTASPFALETVLRHQPLNRCKKQFSEDTQNNLDKRRQLCATDPDYPDSGGADTCSGDSGGPLYLKIGSKMQQWGITSFGIACGFDYSVGIYTKVKAFRADIKDFIRGKYENWREVYAHGG